MRGFVPSLSLLTALTGPLLSLPARAQTAPAVVKKGPVEKYLATYKLLGKFLEYRGRMTIVAPSPKDPAQLIRVICEGEQLNLAQVTLHIEARLIVNAMTLLPIQASRSMTGLTLKEPAQLTMERVGDYAVMNNPFGDQFRFHMTLPSESRDPLSALFALRSLPLDDGDVVEMFVALELAGYHIPFFKARFEVRKEPLTGSHGTVSALHIRAHLEAVDRRAAPIKVKRPIPDFQFWLNDNANRELLRIDAEGYGLAVQLEPIVEAPPQLLPRRATLPGITITKAPR